MGVWTPGSSREVRCLIFEDISCALLWHDSVYSLSKRHHIGSGKRSWLEQIDAHECITKLLEIKLWKVVDTIVHEHRQIAVLERCRVGDKLVVCDPIRGCSLHFKEITVTLIAYSIKLCCGNIPSLKAG